MASPMEMTAGEVKQLWRGYCERHKVRAELLKKGEAIIEDDPEFWADRTMDQLLELVSR